MTSRFWSRTEPWPAAVGKPRLSLELAECLPVEWVVGRLRPGREVEAVAAVLGCGYPSLVVVEAPGWRPGLVPFLEDVSRASAGQLKVLLLTRNEQWLPYLRTQLAETSASVLEPIAHFPIGPVGTVEDLLRWFTHAATVFARGRRVPLVPDRGPRPGTMLGEVLAWTLVAARVAGATQEQDAAQWLGEPLLAPSTDEFRPQPMILEIGSDGIWPHPAGGHDSGAEIGLPR